MGNIEAYRKDLNLILSITLHLANKACGCALLWGKNVTFDKTSLTTPICHEDTVSERKAD